MYRAVGFVKFSSKKFKKSKEFNRLLQNDRERLCGQQNEKIAHYKIRY